VKPNRYDLEFWEHCRPLPAWVAVLQEPKPRRVTERNSICAESLHAAINCRATGRAYPRDLSLLNTINLLRIVRRNLARGHDPEYRTLAEYMLRTRDDVRDKHYRRFLRRMRRRPGGLHAP
jgi:hypothetical protein